MSKSLMKPALPGDYDEADTAHQFIPQTIDLAAL